jgi:site-specific DNA-cytosine methylase
MGPMYELGLYHWHAEKGYKKYKKMYKTAGYILDPAVMNKADAESPGHRKDLLYCISYR